MKNYQREYPLFSLCGLNCALCPMHLNKYCPGCGGGEGNQSCAIFRCGWEHGCPEYCFQCGEYPTVSYSCITSRKIMFPLFTNTPPEHCLRCLLSLFLPFNSAFSLKPPRSGTNAPPESVTLHCGQMRSIHTERRMSKTNQFVFSSFFHVCAP